MAAVHGVSDREESGTCISMQHDQHFMQIQPHGLDSGALQPHCIHRS